MEDPAPQIPDLKLRPLDVVADRVTYYLYPRVFRAVRHPDYGIDSAARLLKDTGGRLSVAVRLGDARAYIGWAWCSPRDQFNRAKGRMIAAARMRLGAAWEAADLVMADDDPAREDKFPPAPRPAPEYSASLPLDTSWGRHSTNAAILDLIGGVDRPQWVRGDICLVLPNKKREAEAAQRAWLASARAAAT